MCDLKTSRDNLRRDERGRPVLYVLGQYASCSYTWSAFCFWFVRIETTVQVRGGVMSGRVLVLQTLVVAAISVMCCEGGRNPKNRRGWSQQTNATVQVPYLKKENQCTSRVRSTVLASTVPVPADTKSSQDKIKELS